MESAPTVLLRQMRAPDKRNGKGRAISNVLPFPLQLTRVMSLSPLPGRRKHIRGENHGDPSKDKAVEKGCLKWVCCMLLVLEVWTFWHRTGQPFYSNGRAVREFTGRK